MSEVQEISKVETGETRKTEQVIVFKQAAEEYGLLIDQIKEVVITPMITRMPQTPHYIKGVANIRGNIIAIIDLEDKFGIKENDSIKKHSTQGYTLVIESDEFKMGVLVSEVPNTLTVQSAQIESASAFATNSNLDQDYMRGIIKLDERLVILIDIFKVLSEKDKSTITKRENA